MSVQPRRCGLAVYFPEFDMATRQSTTPHDVGGSDRETIWLGAALCSLSAAGFASLTILGKQALESGFSLPTLLGLRFAGAGLLLALYIHFFRHSTILPERRLALSLFLLGAIGYAGQSSLYFGALSRISASMSSVLLYAYPSFVALFNWVLNRHPPTIREWAALALASSGVALTLGANSMALNPAGDPAQYALGGAMALASAAGYALYIVTSERLVHRAGAWLSTAWISSGAGLSFLAAGWLTGSHHFVLTPVQTGMLLAMILFSTILPLGTLLAGIRLIGPNSASLISTLEPIFTVIAAILLLHERLAPNQFAGGTLVLLAVVLLTLPAMRRRAAQQTTSEATQDSGSR